MPAGALLMCYVTVLLFVMVLKAFVTDGTTPRKRAKKLLADALFRLAQLLKRVATAFMNWLEKIALIACSGVQLLVLCFVLHHRVVRGPSPCWPQGYPHTHYA